jgi:hypothetical protein
MLPALSWTVLLLLLYSLVHTQGVSEAVSERVSDNEGVSLRSVGTSLLHSFNQLEQVRSTVLQQRHKITPSLLSAAFTLEGRSEGVAQNLSFRVSSTPFVTSAGFRDLCFPHVLDNM